MSDVDKQTQVSDSPIIRLWQRIPVLIRAIVSGVFVTFVGVGAWLLCLAVIPAPWSAVVMGGILWLYWKYFSGSWWPRSTAEARSQNFRAVKLSPAVWKWSLAGTFLFVVILQSATVLTFRLIEFPAEASADYGLDALPVWVAWITIIMASLVAGVCEEIGFRGYMQVPLEERYGPAVGITIVSIMFTIFHLNQAWAAAGSLSNLCNKYVVWHSCLYIRLLDTQYYRPHDHGYIQFCILVDGSCRRF